MRACEAQNRTHARTHALVGSKRLNHEKLPSFSKSREQASRNELLLRENGWKRIHRHAIKTPRGCRRYVHVHASTRV